MRRYVLALANDSNQVDANPGFLRDTRSVLALMIFLRITGLAINEGDNEGGGKIAELWEDTANFETMCVSTLNRMVSNANLERLNILGEFSDRSGLVFSGGARNVILNLLGWT
jgi:hypothetical protein